MSTLQELFQRSAVWRIGDRPPPRTDGLATGFTALDRELSDGGWPRGALTELLCDHIGIGELALMLPALARLTAEGETVAWVAPPHMPYAPRLAADGARPQRLLLVQPAKPAVALWAAERILRDLERAHPAIRQITQRIDLWRWAHAMPKPVPGFLSLPIRKTLEDLSGALLFGHSDLSGLSLFEEANHAGATAATRALR